MNGLQAMPRIRGWGTRCCRLISVTILTLTNAMAAMDAIAVDSPMDKREFREDASRVASVVKSKDLKKIDQTAENLHAKWQGKDRQQHADLMLMLCEPLRSSDIKGASKRALARKYALWGLSNPDDISLETEEGLAGYVTTDMTSPSAPTGKDWTRQRKEDVEAWLHAWQRLSDALDPTWDPKELPQSNVAPPAATGLPAGVAPEAIKDPTLRREYEVAIAQNERIAERRRTQYQLRHRLKKMSSWAEKYVVDAYSKSPHNLKELEQLLQTYVKDNGTRMRILNAVKEKMAAK